MAQVADDCAAQLFVCAVQVSALDATGAPTGTPYVSSALAKATLTPVYTDGDEIKEKTACGEALIDVLDDPSFTRADIELDFLTPDPYLHAVLISDGDLLLSGGAAGFAFPPVGKLTTLGVSVQLWAKRYISGAVSQAHPYALWALPSVRSLKLGPREFSGTAAQHSVISGQCNENANWGTGPGTFWTGVTPGPTRCAQWIPVDTIPTSNCDAFGS